MDNPFALPVEDLPYRAKLHEILVAELYRRALLPLLLVIPILLVLYRVVHSAVAVHPVLDWVFAGMALMLVTRLAAVVCVNRIKARYPDPRIRVGVFAVAGGALGAGMAIVNIMAAPVVGPEQLALMAIIAAGINSIAIVSMSPSLLTYLVYMVPNIASMAVAVSIGPQLEYHNSLLFLICLNLLSLIVMACYVHLSLRNSILLRLRVDDAYLAQQDSNRRLESEIGERLAAEAHLTQRNLDLEMVNRQLATAHGQLLQSEKLASVGRLAAGIAHEINNPIAFVRSNLNSLNGYTKDIFAVLDAYEEAAGTWQASDKVRQLKRAANMALLREDIPSLISESTDGLTRVGRIIRDLREFTHLDNAEWQCTDIQDGLERSLSVAMHEIGARAGIVREYVPLPTIECMPAHINQVFLNLLINAAQAIAPPGTITLRTGFDDQFVWVQVSDTGKGIAAEHLGHIFDPFFTTKTVWTGVGLGLSTCFNIVQRHGGRIDVASEVGKGSTFTVYLSRHARRAGPGPAAINVEME
jgi:signal transduction histidine kinase